MVPIPKETVQLVLERAGGKCELCRSPVGCQIHHIVKRSQRVNHDPENLILLCWECHHGTYGVHGKHGHLLDVKLKKRAQAAYFNKGLSEEEVRYKMGGRLY